MDFSINKKHVAFLLIVFVFGHTIPSHTMAPTIHPSMLGKELLVATALGDFQAIERFLKLGADPNFLGRTGRYPLHIAAQFGDVTIISLLLRFGANPTFIDSDGKTPYDTAIQNEHHLAAAQLLIALRKQRISLRPDTPVRMPASLFE